MGLATLAAALGVADRPARGEGSPDPSASNVELEIGVGTGRGRVLCGVYERSGWLKKPVNRSIASIHGRTATCKFSGLRPGTYAAGAFQDENLNGRLDRSWTGMPAEPWCVTRESRGTFGPPSFDAASFSASAGVVHVRCRAH